ncbi:ogr/Delta-like zinc finger family protein [Roseospira marina]|nr:ogr/Delta-like zinc finger family protein [Roseospira marina]MBB4316121.1 hypothetical protein [Roseospira marina]MBB5089319.1 hypothetical protein [Roseospira marina]
MKRPKGRHAQSVFRNQARCPVCGTGCRTAKTHHLTAAVTEITYVCPNEDCGMVWVGQLYPLRILEPSRLPAAPPRAVPVSAADKRGAGPVLTLASGG